MLENDLLTKILSPFHLKDTLKCKLISVNSEKYIELIVKTEEDVLRFQAFVKLQ